MGLDESWIDRCAHQEEGSGAEIVRSTEVTEAGAHHIALVVADLGEVPHFGRRCEPFRIP